ncbi:MAG: hypothetical protein AUJ47_07355 [Candidatus Marinimicrobia bacterium CG1_02_48_14]|nr:MAG: hypothetical protein AUJ47_07355 [Candidatus Marinimicrobia bacterium CG1_02_48_14]
MHILDVQQFPTGLAIRWDDAKESFIEYKPLRDACPCANCSGESDIFGTKYFGIKRKKNEQSYHLVSVQKVGHYAIQLAWADKHDSGIYTYELLRQIDLSENAK